MYIRKSLRKLKEFTNEAIPRLKAIELPDDLVPVRDLTVTRYETLNQQLEARIAEMRTESIEADKAGDRLDEAVSASIDAYGTAYKGLRIGHLQKQITGSTTDKSHVTNLNRFLEGNNPSDFQKVGVAAKIGYLERAFQFRDQFLDDAIDAALIDQAEQALEQLRLAHEAWVTETQEAAEVADELDAFEERARTVYTAGRHWMRGCLTDIGRADSLSELIPPLRAIYGSDTSEDADEPAPEPNPEPTPA